MRVTWSVIRQSVTEARDPIRRARLRALLTQYETMVLAPFSLAPGLNGQFTLREASEVCLHGGLGREARAALRQLFARGQQL